MFEIFSMTSLKKIADIAETITNAGMHKDVTLLISIHS